jgi:hypothetical protein
MHLKKKRRTRHESFFKSSWHLSLLAWYFRVGLHGFGNFVMYELNQRVIAIIDGNEKICTIVGRTHEQLPKYDVRLGDGEIVANIRSIRELDE